MTASPYDSDNIRKINYASEVVLVVDDDEVMRKVVTEMLKHLGFKTSSVRGAEEAITLLKKGKKYTILLTDIHMPGIDGLELLSIVKSFYPNICSIAMTGFSEKYSYIDVVNAGASDFINKPFGVEELEAKIRRTITERNIKSELERLSITDSLTGLFNQRQFHAKLKDEVARAKRQKTKLGLILLDLDNFKNYNDEHGHLAGDDLLQRFSQIIKNQVRENVDSCYRYGGDEFVIILIDADTEAYQRIGARIKSIFKKEFNETVSIGCSVFSEDMTAEEFLAVTDKKLYEGKKQKKEQLTNNAYSV